MNSTQMTTMDDGSHLREANPLRECTVGDIVFIATYENREHFDLPGRCVVLDTYLDTVLLQNIMCEDGLKRWMPGNILVTQVFSPTEKRRAFVVAVYIQVVYTLGMGIKPRPTPLRCVSCKRIRAFLVRDGLCQSCSE